MKTPLASPNLSTSIKPLLIQSMSSDTNTVLSLFTEKSSSWPDHFYFKKLFISHTEPNLFLIYANVAIFRVRNLPSTCSSYFSPQPSMDKLHRIPANPVLPFTTKWFIIPLTVNALPILLLRITV